MIELGQFGLVWVEVVVGGEVEGSDPREEGWGIRKPRLRLSLKRSIITDSKVMVVQPTILVSVGGDNGGYEDCDDGDVEDEEQGGWGQPTWYDSSYDSYHF